MRGWRTRTRLALLVVVFASWAAEAVAEPPRGAASKRPPILSGCEYDYSPFSIVKEDKRADGFSVQLLRAALHAMGRDVEFKAAPWAELKQDLADGRLQALPMVARTPEREAIFDFTFPYLTMHGTIVVRDDDTEIHGPADLKGKRVAVLEEDVAHEYLRRAKLGAVIVPLPSFAVAMRELSAGKHDAVVIQKLLAFQLMKEAGLKNLRTVGPPLTDYSQVLCFAVPKGNKELLSLLNEGLSIVLADGTFRRLYSEWFSSLEAMARTRSRIVVGGDRDYPPYEFLDRNGQPAGYNVDLTRAIARQMGLSVDIRLGSWAEIRDGLDRGDVDVVQGMFYSGERDRSFDFSPPHSVVNHVIVVRAASPPLSDMRALAGKSILVMAGDIMHELALQSGYGEHVVPVETQEEALRLLAAGEHDCALVARLPALRWIEQNGWRNLRVSDRPVLSAEYCYAVPTGKAGLLSEFAEGLAAVEKSGEYRAIQTRWLGPYEHPTIGFWTVLRFALYGAVPLGALLLGALLWSRSLKTQVRRRTHELQKETEALAESQRRTQQAEERARRHNAVLAGIARIFHEALTSRTQQDLGRICLAVAEDVTQSKFGFLGDVDGETGFLDDVAISDPGWDVCRMQDQSGHGTRGRVGLKLRGIYGRVLLDGKSLFTNDPASHPDRIGTPPGHPPLRAFLGVPLVHAGKTVGMLGLGNREGGYGPEEVGAAEALAPAIVQAFQSKRADDAVRAANAQLTEVDQRKSEFLAVLSHELRNPLAPIRNSLYLLDRASRGSDQEARAKAVIERQVNQLAKLVDDLLDVTRISRGKINLSRARIDARDVVRRTCDDHRAAFERRRVELRVDLPAGPAWIDADETRMSQVIGNLLQNAAKFTPDGGCTSASVEAVGGRAEIRVRDDGIGIEPELLGRVFEPFAQAERGLARTQGGLGLGLALVKGLVQLHGGFVTASSEGPNRGSEFLVSLPLAADAGDVRAEARAARPTSARVIVIIEDNLDAAQSLSDVLTLQGHRVHLATHGSSGVAKVREVKPDLVLCDIGLPDVTGYDVARMLRGDEETRSVHLVALSGYAQPEDRHRAAEAGFDAHLAKPADLDKLTEIVARSPLRAR